MTKRKSLEAGNSSSLQRSSPITSSFKAINHGSRWRNILLAGDKFMQTVKLEGAYADHNRYLCIVCHCDEYALLGVDEEVSDAGHCQATVGLVCKIVHGMQVVLDGDGGFTYIDIKGQFIFKPVSVQALWTVIQTLHMIAERLRPVTTIAEHDWIRQYEAKVNSPQSCINEWHTMADVLVRRPPSPHRTPKSQQRENRRNRFEASQDFEIMMKSQLRQIMKASNLDTITSKKIRTQLEGALGQSLEEYKSFIDKEILVILGQMDPASKIMDYLYLGSEWNASNLEELHANGITHILNVTREIDNFFPADFKYKNIRVYDEEATDLLRYFDETYKFMKEAKDSSGKVLVHCKMGISRSATCTISFIMKEYSRDLASTLIHVKEKRSIVNPNKSFIQQLEVYEGILGAFRHRQYYHSRLFRSKSESSIPVVDSASVIKKSPVKSIAIPIETSRYCYEAQEASNSSSSKNGLHHHHHNCGNAIRPKSWSPNDKIAHFLMDQADRLNKSATADNVIDDCSCFDQLSLQISELIPTSPVNSVCNVIDPHCECNVELELIVPNEPVCVNRRDPDDLQTDVIVQSLTQLPIQMRTSSSLLEDFRSSQGGSISSSVSSNTSVPTTPIFSLKRRSSVDAAFLNKVPPQQPVPTKQQQQQQPPAPPPLPNHHFHATSISSTTTTTTSRLNRDEVLSVKTLANYFDFNKVSTIPFRPCSARLEDNHIFQRMAKQLDNDNETDC